METTSRKTLRDPRSVYCVAKQPATNGIYATEQEQRSVASHRLRTGCVAHRFCDNLSAAEQQEVVPWDFFSIVRRYCRHILRHGIGPTLILIVSGATIFSALNGTGRRFLQLCILGGAIVIVYFLSYIYFWHLLLKSDEQTSDSTKPCSWIEHNNPDAFWC